MVYIYRICSNNIPLLKVSTVIFCPGAHSLLEATTVCYYAWSIFDVDGLHVDADRIHWIQVYFWQNRTAHNWSLNLLPISKTDLPWWLNLTPLAPSSLSSELLLNSSCRLRAVLLSSLAHCCQGGATMETTAPSDRWSQRQWCPVSLI